MNLLISLYNEESSQRLEELLFCLNKNINNSYISKIIIFIDGKLDYEIPSHPKLKFIYLISRPCFRDLFNYANNNFSSDSIKIVANSDIYFDDTLKYVVKYLSFGTIFCLTRWNHHQDNSIRYYLNFKSQDVWLYKGSIPNETGNFFLGLPGSDNRLACELKNCGLKVKNPSFNLRSIHLHNSTVRNYNKITDRVKGIYYYPLPSFLSFNLFDKQSLDLYLLIRRKYYKGVLYNELEGISFNKFSRFLALFNYTFYRFLYKLSWKTN